MFPLRRIRHSKPRNRLNHLNYESLIIRARFLKSCDDIYGERSSLYDVDWSFSYAGPVVSSSATRLIMVCTSEYREVKKRIRLVNDSKATATFLFDVDSLRRSFQTNPRHGQIRPRSHKYVTITFAPREDGIYACHFPCLILNHVMGKFEFLITTLKYLPKL